MKTYNETLTAAKTSYTHIEIDGQLRDIDDIIAIGGADGDTGAWVLDADSIERLNDDGTRTGESYRLVAARPLLLIPAVTLCDSGLGDIDSGLVYETAADARAHLADLISEMESDRDDQLIDRVVDAAVTLDNPTAAQLAEAELHSISPRYVRNGHSVGVCAGDLSAAHRAALDGGAEVRTGNGAILRARRSGSRCYYNARLQPGYRWSDSYSKNPTPVRA